MFSPYSDPTQMGGLSMLLLAGEHALSTPEVSQSLVPLHSAHARG